VKLDRGAVVLVSLDPTLGHEQRGARPCIVISDPLVIDSQRFSMVAVVPISGTPGEGALYPLLRPGDSGLRKPSYGLIDQLRTIDKRRIRSVFGTITGNEMDAVDEGLRLFLGLSGISTEPL